MLINKIRPQRTFSPRSYFHEAMGDRGFQLDTLGRVMRSSESVLFDDEKIVAPKPWKAGVSPVLSRAHGWEEDSLFNEAGQEIQTILFNSFNTTYQRSTQLDISNESIFRDSPVEESLEMHFPVFSASPCSATVPITPPTRSHNPMVLDSSFSLDNERVPEGAELGLLSVSPPTRFGF